MAEKEESRCFKKLAKKVQVLLIIYRYFMTIENQGGWKLVYFENDVFYHNK